jgi:hypothetical protein
MKPLLLLVIFIIPSIFALDCTNINCSIYSFDVCYWRSKYDSKVIKECCPYSGGYEEYMSNRKGHTCCCPHDYTGKMRNENRNKCLQINTDCYTDPRNIKRCCYIDLQDLQNIKCY